MNRLLEGDVGSGKTVVATIAALATTKSGYQAAFMAPTEVLATQHFKKVSKLLMDFKLNIGFLTGKKDKFKSKKLKRQFIEISRKKLLEKVKEGEIDLLIGTHALIQDKVTFDNLGLVIVDEQHRFGVEQRAKLCKKKTIPHLLSMTATPIPRTLALTIYGDLDISIIDELPAGRKKIETKVVKEKNRAKIYSFIRQELKKERQAFFICPRIEEAEEEDQSPWADVKSVEEVTKHLKKEFSDFKIESLHGKIASNKKAKIMEDFKNQKIDILVSTSVVEVGVDIPNATVMVIEGAEMFGLAQLHQFRGRVGRNDYKSYCFLFSNSNSEKSRKRLKALINSEDSFELAEKDLQLRGPGDLAGKRQWGIASFTMEALQDKALVQDTKEAAKNILEMDSNLNNYPLIKRKLKSVEKNLHFE
jgi:ATP-dependent DNA helicase RecG